METKMETKTNKIVLEVPSEMELYFISTLNFSKSFVSYLFQKFKGVKIFLM